MLELLAAALLTTDPLGPPVEICGQHQCVQVAKIGAGSPCDEFNSREHGLIAPGDILMLPKVTSPDQFELLVTSDCHFAYDSGGTEQQAIMGMRIWSARHFVKHKTGMITGTFNVYLHRGENPTPAPRYRVGDERTIRIEVK